MEVVAKERGYFGGVLREIGDRFVIDDEIMNDKKRRPSWVRSAKGAAKAEDDNAPPVMAQFSSTDGVVVPEGWEKLSAKDKKALADEINAAIGNDQGKVANVKEADEVITAYLGGVSKSAPFSDAPAPETAQGNGVQEALAANQPTPDWIAPAGDNTPVQADD